VHHDACRCDGTRKTIPGWEYQFVAALGHLRTAWAALVDAGRTTATARTVATIRQVKNLLRRLRAAVPASGDGAPLVVFDAGYSAAALTAALAGQPVHLLVRLAAGSVLYADPVTWPGKKGRPGKHGMPVTCHNDPGEANPEPDESLLLPDTAQYGHVHVDAWHDVHPVVHGDRGWFAGHRDGPLPVLRGTVLRVRVEHLPDGRTPHKTMWLWHAGPAPLSLDELWRAYLARFDEEHAFRFTKGHRGLTAPKARAPEQADRWIRLVMAAHARARGSSSPRPGWRCPDSSRDRVLTGIPVVSDRAVRVAPLRRRNSRSRGPTAASTAPNSSLMHPTVPAVLQFSQRTLSTRHPRGQAGAGGGPDNPKIPARPR
jgi:hypothetical protein